MSISDEEFPGLEPFAHTNAPLTNEAFASTRPKDHAITVVAKYIESQKKFHGEHDSFIEELISKLLFLNKAIELVTNSDKINKELAKRGRHDLLMSYPVETPALASPEVFDTQLDEDISGVGPTNNFAQRFVLLKRNNSGKVRSYTQEEITEALARKLFDNEAKTHLAKKALQRAVTLFDAELPAFIEKISKRALECQLDKNHWKFDYVQEYAEEFFIWHEILRHLVDATDENAVRVNENFFIE
jgi:hypothetical protein